MQARRILALALVLAWLAGGTGSAGESGASLARGPNQAALATTSVGQLKRVTILYTGFGCGNVDVIEYCST